MKNLKRYIGAKNNKANLHYLQIYYLQIQLSTSRSNYLAPGLIITLLHFLGVLSYLQSPHHPEAICGIRKPAETLQQGS